jgi:hypothetical protein
LQIQKSNRESALSGRRWPRALLVRINDSMPVMPSTPLDQLAFGISSSRSRDAPLFNGRSVAKKTPRCDRFSDSAQRSARSDLLDEWEGRHAGWAAETNADRGPIFQ